MNKYDFVILLNDVYEFIYAEWLMHVVLVYPNLSD